MVETQGGSESKGRRRAGAKAPERQAPSKLKVSLHLSPEADRKLSIHATMSGQDRSEVVEALIHSQLKRWVVSDRGGAGEGAGESAA